MWLFKKVADTASPSLDVIESVIGPWGLYQTYLFIVLFFCKLLTGWYQMSIIFIAPPLHYSCNGKDNDPCPCDNPEYKFIYFKNTMTTQWKLVCGEKWKISFNQLIFQLGVLIGSMIVGMLSDRFGRKYPFCATTILQVAASLGAAYASSYWIFTAMRMINGIAVGGMLIGSFVLCMEFTGTKYRDVLSAMLLVPFTLGHMTLPAFAYFVRDYWRQQFWMAIVSIVLLPYFLLLPETARWCLSQKRTEQAIKILEKAAKCNKRPTNGIASQVWSYQAYLESHQLHKGTIIDLFRTPNMRKHIIVMAINWLSCSYCFYGLSQLVGTLSGNIFYNVAVSGALNTLSCFLSIPLLHIAGRRSILIIMNFICFICLLLLAFVPKGIVAVLLACSGSVCAFIVFITVYLYCGELFPTVVRSAAMGFSSMCARVGSMVAPFVIDSADRFGHWCPPLIFAICPFIVCFLSWLLPETKGTPLMTTLEEGEEFGKGETCKEKFRSFFKLKKKG